MANLWTGRINTGNTYEKLATLSSQTFQKDDVLYVQVQNTAWVREGTTGDGFLVNSDKPFKITFGTDDIYIKTAYQDCIVNIADGTGITF